MINKFCFSRTALLSANSLMLLRKADWPLVLCVVGWCLLAVDSDGWGCSCLDARGGNRATPSA